MNNIPPLKLGTAYHGNRMPHHARKDLEDIVSCGMNLVVHMLSQNDISRHKERIKDIVAISNELGLEVWLDCWGIIGPPGDVGNFLAYHPECHMRYSDGNLAPVHACLRHPQTKQHIHEWIDAAEYVGGKNIFWDELHMPYKTANGKKIYSCTCPLCQKAFKEKYGKDMPEFATEETEEFGIDTMVGFMRDVTDYSASKGMKNVTCMMMTGDLKLTFDQLEKFYSIPNLDNIGSDPYWSPVPNVCPNPDVYKFVYDISKENVRLSNKYQKDHNLWIKAYSIAPGTENDIILAAEAAYNAGARTIISWSYYGGESNNYASKHALATWTANKDAVRRLRNKEIDRVLKECEKTMPSVYENDK